MHTQDFSSKETSGQLDPKHHENTVIPFIINGCSVTFKPSSKDSAAPLAAIKEILMSAYRTKPAKG